MWRHEATVAPWGALSVNLHHDTERKLRLLSVTRRFYGKSRIRLWLDLIKRKFLWSVCYFLISSNWRKFLELTHYHSQGDVWVDFEEPSLQTTNRNCDTINHWSIYHWETSVLYGNSYYLTMDNHQITVKNGEKHRKEAGRGVLWWTLEVFF